MTKPVKTEKVIPDNVKTAFVSVPHFLVSVDVPAKLKAIIKDVELKTFAGGKSYQEGLDVRRKMILSADCIIIAIGAERNISPGVVFELTTARKNKKPIYLFNAVTNKIEKYLGHRMTAHFLPISEASKARKLLVREVSS